MSRGRRYDDTPKLNIKKVIATLVAILVVVMVVISIKKLLISDKPKTKEVSTIQTYFPVYIEEKWGVIDNLGESIVSPIYDEMVVVPDKSKDLFICTYDVDYNTENYKTKVLSKNGEILTEYNNVQAIENSDESNIWYENDILKFKQNEKYGLINFSGKLILEAEYDDIYALQGFEKNLIIEQNGKKGLVNTSMGEIIIKPEYDQITTLTTDTYENGYIVSKDGMYGIISADAKIIFEPVYNKIFNVTANGYYVVSQDSSTKLINQNGETILDSGFDEIKEINADNLIIMKNGKYGVINSSGENIIKPEYEDLKYVYGIYYIAKMNGLYGVISTENEQKVDFEYENMEYIKTADFIEADDENYQTDLIDRDFNVVLKNVIVSELNLDNGYIRVREGNEYNYYNFKFEKKESKEVLTTSTLFLYKENGKYGYENKNGQRVVDPIYDEAREQNKYGYCAVKKNGLWGCLKSDGTVVLAPSVNLDDYLYVDFIKDWHLIKDLNTNIYTK